MGVDVASDLLGGQVEALCQGQLRQQLGDVRADHVTTDELAVLGVHDDLDEADALVEAHGLAVGAEREGRDLDLAAVLLGVLSGCLLGVTEGRDLRGAEGGARHVVVVAELLGLGTGDGLGGDDTLCLGDVGKLELRGDVTDGVDVRDVGAHALVDVDGATLGELDTGVLQAKALHTRGEADGDHDTVGLDGLGLGAVGGLDVDLDALVAAEVAHGGGLVTGLQVHAELLVLLGDLLGDVLVLVGQDAVHELDDGDVDAEVGQDVGELHADGTGTDDDHGLRGVLVEDLLLVGDDVAADVHTRQGLHDGTGRDDRIVEGEGLARVLPLRDLDRVRVGEGTETVDLGDPVLLHQVVDTLDDARRDLSGPLVRDPVVHADVVTADAEGLGIVGEDVRDVRVTDQRLGRDTAHVEADTAPVLLLDNGGLETQLGRPDGGDVPAGARADNYYVIMFSHGINGTRSGPIRRVGGRNPWGRSAPVRRQDPLDEELGDERQCVVDRTADDLVGVDEDLVEEAEVHGVLLELGALLGTIGIIVQGTGMLLCTTLYLAA